VNEIYNTNEIHDLMSTSHDSMNQILYILELNIPLFSPQLTFFHFPCT